MFAVPGWHVDASGLKRQTTGQLVGFATHTKAPKAQQKPRQQSEQKKEQKSAEQKSRVASCEAGKIEEQASSTGKKRKRGSGGRGATSRGGGGEVNADNVAALYEKHLGSGGVRAAKKRKNDTKHDLDVQAGGAAPVSESKTGEDDFMEGLGSTKKSKKERRERLDKLVAQGSSTTDKKAREGAGQHSNKSEKKNQILDPDTQHAKDTTAVTTPDSSTKMAPSAPPAAIGPPAPKNLTPLQTAMRQKLISSRFRYLNQTLYTTPSASSLELFTTNPSFFTEYHEGFARQVEAWPQNPVDGFVRWIYTRGNISVKGWNASKVKQKDRPAVVLSADNGTEVKVRDDDDGKEVAAKEEPLPRHQKSHLCTIADLGCGAAQLSLSLQSCAEALKLKIHSFDLAAASPLVTVADIKSLPLKDGEVDVVVFCLALMSTNWIDFVEEAWRVLRWKGECWIADVASRFASVKWNGGAGGRVAHSVGLQQKKGAGNKGAGSRPWDAEEEEDGDELAVEEEGAAASAKPENTTDVGAFIDVLRRRGFVIVGDADVSNKMFVRMRFVKALAPLRGRGATAQEKKGNVNGFKQSKFIERREKEDEITVEDEAKILKPCVYKTR